MTLDTDMASSVPDANFTIKMLRFATLSDEQQQELLENRQSKITRDQTKSHLKILNEYLNQKNIGKLDDLSDDELPDILFGFYTSVRREDGEMYKLQSLKCIRASINRYTKEKHNLDIIADTRFIKANEMFHAVTVQTNLKQDTSV